ncbi:Ger(x)C family spore germination protein [Paenibacillus aestuarii]|uniref:Ger(X)C family spore germination protein n=1 Tax=Paenibacillus aestuarii TaxID=516965 RepID=A0ABW0K8X5_9BACL|nr:Ger(x)C family spore germination protein [Paenibacillus aestuarii]
MKPFLCIVLLLTMCLTSGCWDRKEINDLAFISGAAGDIADDGDLIVSFQIAIPVDASKSGGGGQQKKFFMISAKGKNVTEILQILQKKTSRMLFTAHRSVVFISERLAKHGIEEVLDIFTHDPRNRLRTYIMVVKGAEARDILQAQYPFEQVSIEAVKEMEILGSESGVTLRDFFLAAASEGISPIMGVIELEDPSQALHGNNKFKLAGTAIFKDYKLTGILNDKETTGYLWVKNGMKFCRVSAELEEKGGNVGVLFTHIKGSIKPDFSGDQVRLKLQLQGQGSLIENNTTLDIRQKANLKLVEKAIEKSLKQQVKEAVFKVQEQYQTDSFGFGQAIYRHNPKAWKKLKASWDKTYPEVDVSIDVKLTISESGMSGPPLQLGEKEIVK